MARRAGEIRVGVGGWTFEPWRGVFYPKDLPQRRELEYAAGRLTSIEINGADYGVYLYVISGAKERNPAAAQAFIERS